MKFIVISKTNSLFICESANSTNPIESKYIKSFITNNYLPIKFRSTNTIYMKTYNLFVSIKYI